MTISAINAQTVCLLEKPVPQEKLESVIECVVNKTITIIKVNGSALSAYQVQQLDRICLQVKGVKVVNLEGGYVGGVHTNWSLYQSPQLKENPQLRPSPEKAVELYKSEYKEMPKRAIDFGAGPGINIVALLLEGVEWVDAIDCDPDMKDDFSKYLTYLKKDHFASQVAYHTSEFDKWEPQTPADLLVANYTWPYRSPDKFITCWKKTIDVVRSGGYLCGEFFEPPTDHLKKITFTYHSLQKVKELVEKDCTLLWFEKVSLKKSRSSLDLQSDTQNQPLPWGGLIRIVARKL